MVKPRSERLPKEVQWMANQMNGSGMGWNWHKKCAENGHSFCRTDNKKWCRNEKRGALMKSGAPPTRGAHTLQKERV